jgi:L-arabinose isomerase
VGKVVRGPLLEIGNTTSRVDFGREPGEWTDAWRGSAVGHHWARRQAPATGDIIPELRALSGPSGLELVEVTV